MPLLEGRVAIVTGGGRGIGRAVALAFAREGARVLVNDIGVDLDGTGGSPEPAEEVARTIRSQGGAATSSIHDVSTATGADALLEACTKELGDVDVLATCAGIVRDAPMQSVTEADLRRILDVHVLGTVFGIQRVSARMKRRQGGRIVVTTGLAGLLGNYGQAGYAAAAAGIYGFARTAAIELQRHGITVNLVAPLAKTRATQDLPMFEHVDSMPPEHAAGPYVFFASPLCADRTGHVLAVAGGRVSVLELTELPGQFKESVDGAWTAEDLEAAWPVLSRR
jgi:NAD(P)-dependent dehydrogenase (short-subunit alcohol dehydrogenase family)